MSLIVSTGPVTTVTLNRPEVRNAFNEELIAGLTAWAESVPADGSIRAAVLQGAGSVFCAGADVQWMAKMIDYTREENLEDARRAARMLHALDAVPHCFISAAYRPDLKTAVSEKRRREAEAMKGPDEEEVPCHKVSE